MARPEAILLAATLALLAPAAAQDAPVGSGPSARTPEEYERIKGEIAETERQRAQDEAEHARALAELEALRREAAAVAAEVQTLERDLTLADNRIVALETRDMQLADALEARRQTIAPLLAALQRMRRDQPPALAVSPGDAAAAARGAMLIAAVTQKLEIESRALVSDLATLSQTRVALAAERENALSRQETIAARKAELGGLIARRQEIVETLAEGVLAADTRIAQLEARNADMADLMAWIEETPAAPPAADAPSDARPVTVAGRGSKQDFAKMRGQLLWPAAGDVTARFGEPGENGTPAHGVTLRTRPEAQITAPADGEIVFAGTFGEYGRLLILAPADGYFVLIGGAGRLDATTGQHVLAGEPIGVMGTTPSPAMYIELRRSGKPVDPQAWFGAMAPASG